MPSQIDEYDELESSAPRPVDDRLVSQGNLQQLEEGQGAVQATRDLGNAQRAQGNAAQPLSKRTLVIVLVVGAAVIALVVFLMIRALSGPVPNSDSGTGASSEIEQTTVAADESISYRGSTYLLVETAKGHALAETRAESNDKLTMLGEFDGNPVSLVLYDGALIIPENLPNGSWDVVAYTIGSGWSMILSQDGNAYGGTGVIGEAKLDGSTLHLVVDGAPVDIPLVW